MNPLSKTNRVVLLTGQPNVGKSTLFNALTGSRQKIANFPGATVEKKLGYATTSNGIPLTLVDLPGTYSLNAKTEDERIALSCLLGEQPDLGRPDWVLVVGEAQHLDRSLFLFEQIRQYHPGAVLVLNMMDELEALGKKIDLARLEKIIKAPVFGVSAFKNQGLGPLLTHLENAPPAPQNHSSAAQSQPVGDLFKKVDDWAHQVLQTTPGPSENTKTLTQKIDRFLLNPVLGPLFFIAVLTFMFQTLFSWSGPLTDAVDGAFGLLSEKALELNLSPIWESLLVEGVIGGVGSVLVFVPQIALAFLWIALLETSGYLSRGAFLIDRLMRLIGLEGRSFIPLISSFACALPGIMATRTIASHRQRLITILVAPLMACSARLPVYTLLIATFVPQKTYFGLFNAQGLTLLFLFVLGIMAMAVVSFLLNQFLPKSKTAPTFVMELPKYRWPQGRYLYLYISTKVFSFIKSAGTVIFILSLGLWALAYFPHEEAITQKYDEMRVKLNNPAFETEFCETNLEQINHEEAGAHLRNSYMGRMGLTLEPLFSPMGADWRMGIALISSFAAREVFVSTLAVVFNLGEANEESESLRTLLTNSKNQNGEPLYSYATAMAVLVFFALAAQCLSTLAVIQRETRSYFWAFFTFFYMSVLAYTLAVLTFQLLKPLT